MQTFDLAAARCASELHAAAQKDAPTRHYGSIVNPQGQLTRLPCGLERRST